MESRPHLAGSQPSGVAGTVRPFLKWAGGKVRSAAAIRALLPPGRRLIEPFAGSAAVWLNTGYEQALLADANADLIACYRQLQAHGDDFIAACRSLFVPANNWPEPYYRLRRQFNASRDPWERAVLFVYLNRHGYNGLCRYNASGEFNVPFGRYRRPYFPEAEMRIFYRRASQAHFVCDDFRSILAQARPGDVVYCDPPYVPWSTTANFTAYAAPTFGPPEQQALADWARRLAMQGIPVLISNHATAWIQAAYHGARVRILPVQRFISCKGADRQAVPEVLALFEPRC